MDIKNASAEERSMLLSAIELSIASCERRCNRAGEIQPVKEELMKQAERYRLLKTQIALTK